MGFWSGVGRVFQPVTNISQYIGVGRIAEGAGLIVGLVKWLLTTETAGRKESFDEAMQRLNLTEKDLQARSKEFTRIVWILGTLTFLLLGYTIYLYLNLFMRAGLVASAVTLLAAAVTFRYHFWLFQIKQRQLGLSISEWFKHGVLRLSK